MDGAHPPPTHGPSYDKKFSLVFYGLDECPQGTHFVDRSIRDKRAVSSVVRALDTSLSSVSIRDTIRLGRYRSTNPRPRPLLVKFNEAGDVMSILANRKNLSQSFPHVLIKPDMTKEQRDIEHILLKERKALIASGKHRQDIKLKGNRLFLLERLYGTANSQSFIKSPALSDFVSPSPSHSSANICPTDQNVDDDSLSQCDDVQSSSRAEADSADVPTVSPHSV